MSIPPPNIPSLSSKVDSEVRRAFASIKDWLNGTLAKGGLATQRDLDSSLDSINDALTPFIDTTIPPILTNFTVTGAFRTIMIQWDSPNYARFSHVEICRNTIDDLGTAIKIGTTDTFIYSDLPPNSSLSVTYYYWGRIVSTSGMKGPYNATEGTPGSTANDPEYMLELLQNQLSTSELNSDLNSRINTSYGLVDTLDTLSQSILDALPDQYGHYLDLKWQQAVTDAVIEVDPETGQIRLIATAEVTTDVENRLTTVEQDMDAVSGTIVSHTNTLAEHGDDIEANATLIGQQQAQIDLMATSAYVDGKVAEATQGVDNTSILTGQDLAAEATLWHILTSGNIAHANMQFRANANAISAEAAARLVLASQVNNNYAVLLQEQITRVNENSAMTSSVEILQSTVGENTASIEVLAESVDGIEAEYTIKIDSNGRVIGIGLMNDGVTSSFNVVADKITFAPVATNPDAADGAPFFYLTSPQVVGGVTLQPGLYLKKASITDLTSANIRAMSIAADRLNVTYLSSISANLGTITGGSMEIGGVGGKLFKVETDGTMTITSAGAAGMTVTNDAITVSDGSVVRVRIGLLP